MKNIKLFVFISLLLPLPFLFSCGADDGKKENECKIGCSDQRGKGLNACETDNPSDSGVNHDEHQRLLNACIKEQIAEHSKCINKCGKFTLW